MTHPLLEARDLARKFGAKGRETTVFEGVSLAARPGEVTVIAGKSGEGKSVLLWLLAGLDAPTAGEVFFEGTAYSALSAEGLCRLRRNRMSIVFQDHNLIASFTALENVVAPLAGSGIAKRDQRDRAAAALSSLGLGHRLRHLPAELSIGQRQRVALARTIIVAPRLILADEPTGGLDPETAGEITDWLIGYVKKNSAALVTATHGVFPLAAANGVYRLEKGRLFPVR